MWCDLLHCKMHYIYTYLLLQASSPFTHQRFQPLFLTIHIWPNFLYIILNNKNMSLTLIQTLADRKRTVFLATKLVLFIPNAKGKTCDCYQVIKMILECRNRADKQIMQHHCCCWCCTFYSLVLQVNLTQVSQYGVVWTSICLLSLCTWLTIVLLHGYTR